MRPPAATDLEARFAVLYVRIRPRLFRYARSFVDPDTAEEAVQVAFVRLWEMWGRGRVETEEDPVAAMLFRAVRRLLVDADRRSARERRRLGAYLEDCTARFRRWMEPERAAEAAEIAAIVQRAVLRMPSRRREAWVLVHEGHLNATQAGEVLGVSATTARWHLLMATRELRQALAARGYGPVEPERLANGAPDEGEGR